MLRSGRASRHARWEVGGGAASEGFNPSSLSAVAAWYRVANASNAGAGLAFTLPDMLSSNHAVTSTDARKPTIGTSGNGLPILTCSASCLQAPLSAAINSATKWGFGAWMKVTTAAGNPVAASIDSGGAGGASLRKVLIQRFVGDNILAFDSQTTARRGGPATMWVTNTWAFCTWEMSLDTGEAESVRVVASRGAALQACAYADSNGTPGNFATSMQVPTGSMNLFAQGAAAGGNGWVGDIGPNIYVFGSRMSGATSGLLTPAARTSLMNFEAPT